MQASGYEILERIIHKAMAHHAGLAGERRGSNPHPEMGAKTGAIGPGVTGMGDAFIDHFELRGRKEFRQALVQRLGRDASAGAHNFGTSSVFM